MTCRVEQQRVCVVQCVRLPRYLQRQSCRRVPFIHLKKDMALNKFGAHFKFIATAGGPVRVCPQFSWCFHRRRNRPEGGWLCLMMTHQSLSVVKHPIRGTLPLPHPIGLMAGIFLFNQTPGVLPKYISSLRGPNKSYSPRNKFFNSHVCLHHLIDVVSYWWFSYRTHYYYKQGRYKRMADYISPQQ